MFKAKWTGEYPNLCSGEWIISYNGTRLEIPEDKEDEYSWDNRKGSSMNTYGTYQRWSFDDDWCEHFEDYQDGLQGMEWIQENQHWIDEMFDKYNIPKGFFNYSELYKAIQEKDFRSGSCGGCI